MRSFLVQTRPARWAWGLAWIGLLAAANCMPAVDPAGYGCDGGRCADGYLCHPLRGVCSPTLTTSCTGAGVCPETLVAGDPCDLPYAFVDCSDCLGGIRTCDGAVWGACECICVTQNGGVDIACNTVDEDCDGADLEESGSLANCAGCGNDCNGEVLNATGQLCAGGAAAFACDYSACVGVFADADGDRTNGCECADTNGSVETCDGINNDCSGPVDDVLDLAADCGARVSGNPEVATWSCTAGACAVSACAPDYHDVNRSGGDGCEYACTPSDPPLEACDGVDDDCDGVPDNFAAPEVLDQACAGAVSNPQHVLEWACAGVCSVGRCEAGWTDTNHDGDDGCEEACLPTVDPTEVCGDGADNDCDGRVDDEGASGCAPFYRDADADGVGLAGDSRCLCAAAGVYTVGVLSASDCDDGRGDVYPGAPETVADDVDQDCDGVDTCYQDLDGDDFGSPSVVADNNQDCDDVSAPTSGRGDDCDDGNGAIYPGAADLVADGVNQDCSFGDRCYYDGDGDGFGSASLTDDDDLDCANGSSATALNAGDCDDGNPAIEPSAGETIGDGVDQDCNGGDRCFADLDDDGAGGAIEVDDTDLDCANTSALTAAGSGDCNDGNPQIYPGATDVIADFSDQDCSGGDRCYLDGDGDGHGRDQEVDDNDLDCTNNSAATAAGNLDCDDGDGAIHPYASEGVADGVDQNCDGRERCYRDNDGDGYGDPTQVDDNDSDCDNGSAATASNPDDCSPGNPAAYPGAAENIGDDVDQDCNGFDSCYEDLDNDTYGSDIVVDDNDLDCTNVSALTADRNGDCSDAFGACALVCDPCFVPTYLSLTAAANPRPLCSTTALNIDLDGISGKAAQLSCSAPRQRVPAADSSDPDGIADFGTSEGWTSSNTDTRSWIDGFPGSCPGSGGYMRFRDEGTGTVTRVFNTTGLFDLTIGFLVGYDDGSDAPDVGEHLSVLTCCGSGCMPNEVFNVPNGAEAGGSNGCRNITGGSLGAAADDCPNLTVELAYTAGGSGNEDAALDDLVISGQLIFGAVADDGNGFYHSSIEACVQTTAGVTCTWNDGSHTPLSDFLSVVYQ